MLQEIDVPIGIRPTARNDELEKLFVEAAESLDITPTQREQAEASYAAIGEWLDADDSPLKVYHPLIYPQGSFPLGTLTKPLGRDDFDLDATCVLIVPPWISPALLKMLIGDRLKQHKVYRDMLEEKSRCWRLNYSRDFHMDIIPAKPAALASSSTATWITDRQLLHWLLSDPKGYIVWFDYHKKISRTPFRRNSNLSPRVTVEPMPEVEAPSEKAPLQIAVQILKRHRDVMFQGRDDAPISIIITTLAAHAYRQEGTVLATLRGLVKRMPQCIDYSRGYPFVANPTNSSENFADRWIEFPERERAFYEWVNRLDSNLSGLESAVGLKQVRDALVQFLGNKRADIVLNRQAAKTNTLRGNGLSVIQKTGTLTVSVGVTVPRNSFFGDALF